MFQTMICAAGYECQVNIPVCSDQPRGSTEPIADCGAVTAECVRK